MDKTRANTPATTCFLTVVNSKKDERQAQFLIRSLRSFGGPLQDCPFWVFAPQGMAFDVFPNMGNTSVVSLEMDGSYRQYILAEKVFACAQAETMVRPDIRSLVWLNLDCLVVNPPVLFDLEASQDAALRPVHVKNIGLLASEDLDDYWKTVYQITGVETIPYTVKSVVDSRVLRPYFNTHCFSINPTKGKLQAWRNTFTLLVADKEFQDGPCKDDLHRLFLHQAVFSALILKSLEKDRIRFLPLEYSYPLHLQNRLPAPRRIQRFDQLVCAVYEEPEYLEETGVQELLKTWLAANQFSG
jgi:hypothetical protein